MSLVLPVLNLLRGPLLIGLVIVCGCDSQRAGRVSRAPGPPRADDVAITKSVLEQRAAIELQCTQLTPHPRGPGLIDVEGCGRRASYLQYCDAGSCIWVRERHEASGASQPPTVKHSVPVAAPVAAPGPAPGPGAAPAPGTPSKHRPGIFVGRGGVPRASGDPGNVETNHVLELCLSVRAKFCERPTVADVRAGKAEVRRCLYGTYQCQPATAIPYAGAIPLADPPPVRPSPDGRAERYGF